MTVSNSGKIFLFGSTPYDKPPTTIDAVSSIVNDLHFCAFDATGSTLLYATYLGGSGNDYAGGIVTDTIGNVYLSGATGSGDFPITDGAYDRTYNGGDAFICKFSFGPGPVNVEDTPNAFTLNPVRPNPFNPSTTISFSLPAPSYASLSIYDITGQCVRTLVSGPLSAGDHSATWDGRDDSGQPVASGVYLSRLTAGKHIATGKMVLVK